jgi:uncharacterized protein YegJ (DUF2314 family)
MRVVEDEIVPVASANDDMLDAINDARASIGVFFTAFEDPRPSQTDFHIKARFDEGETSEHIWLSDLDFKTRPATGVVANEPGIGSVSYLERVPFLPDQISDWMYRDGEQLVGGYTTRVLLRAKAKPGGLLALLKRRLTM